MKNKRVTKWIALLSAVVLLFGYFTYSVGNHPAAKASEANVPVNEGGVPLPENYWQRKVVGYFPGYAMDIPVHDNFDITRLQWDKLTHVQYAFVVADPDTYELVPSDPWNDTQNRFEDKVFTHKGETIAIDESLDYYGQFNLMHTMKEMYPDVTVLASTGGWAASRTLWLVTDNEANMRKFAQSAVAFVRKYGFDGIDIDFEYPSETSQSGNPADFDLSEPRRKGIGERYTQFIRILREALNQAALEDGVYYWLTSAVTASSWVLGGQTDSEFLDYFDFVSVMSYDFHGGWNNFVENLANIYADPADKETISMVKPTLGFNWSEDFYRGRIQSEKILMGIPYYTRGWTNVSGGVTGLHGSSNTPAVGNENIWHDLDVNGNETPAGVNPLWHALNLMHTDPNYVKYDDPVGGVPHIWNAVNRTFLSFEDEISIQRRIDYVEENNLGGVLIWVMHGDYDYDPVQDKYVVGDTLTTMLHDQFEGMQDAEITSDIDITAPAADFDVKFSGNYAHPNYTYNIAITNRTGQDLTGYTFSFDLPDSAEFGGSWSGTASVAESTVPGFHTVTINGPAWQAFRDGSTVSLTGMIKLNFAGVKNFKLNGMAMRSEVEQEIDRLNRLIGNGDYPQPTIAPRPTETPEPTAAPEPTEVPEPTAAPEPTEVPEPTAAPEPTEIPEPTAAPEPTEVPEPTAAPEPTEIPEPTTVPEKPDTYDPEMIYVAGDEVVYLGKEYVCKWWTRGDLPANGGPWELKGGQSSGEIETYVPGKAYTGGQKVLYNGIVYQAKWWTTAVPGADDSWETV